MRIFFVGEDDDARKAAASALHDSGHVVRHAHADATAIPAVRQDNPHLVVVSLKDCNDAALDLVRRLREDGKPPPHVVVLGDDVPEPFLVRAYQAGLDGDIRKSAGEAYFRARVESLERRLDPAGRKPATQAKLTPATALDLVSRSGAWREVRKNFGGAVGKFLALGISTGEIPLAPASLAFGCEVLLSSVTHELELRVAIGVDQTTAKTLAVHLFGPESEDLEADMMGEITNICMGTMKTALSSEALAFSAALPKAIAPEEVLRPTTVWKPHEGFVVVVEESRIFIHVGLRSKANASVVLSSLVEGMVLAKDVFNPRGMLLLTAGTRLSQTMVEKLQGMLPPKHAVEVSGA